MVYWLPRARITSSPCPRRLARIVETPSGLPDAAQLTRPTPSARFGYVCWIRTAFEDRVYQGQILGRANPGFGVCGTDNHSDCNTFVMQGATASKNALRQLALPFWCR